MPETPPDPPEKPATETTKPDPAKPIAPTPRQSAASGDRAAASAGSEPTALNQQLMSVLAQALTGQAPPPSPARDDRGLISREEKRFRRAGGSSRSDAPLETPPETRPEPAAPLSKTEPPAVAESKEETTAEKKLAETAATVEPAAQVGAPADKPATATVSLAAAATSTDAGLSNAKPGVDEPAEVSGRRGRSMREEMPTVLRPAAPSMRSVWRTMPGWQRAAITMAVCGLMIFLGYLLGRSASPEVASKVSSGKPTPVPANPAANAAPVTSHRMAEPKEIQLIDEAMKAQTAGDYATASKLLQQLAQDSPDLSGNQMALALLSVQKGDLPGADTYIRRGLDAGEDAGRLYALRAMIEARLNHPLKARDAFEMATRAQPHDFKGFFVWAEYLRRLGKNQHALEKLDQAIARVHEQPDEDLMQFKRRLTLIAMGRGSELEPEIQKEIAKNPPAGDWLLVAMANAAQKDDFTTAAKYLQRATQVMTEDALVDRLRDFYLSQWSYEKAFEPYFGPMRERLNRVRRTEPPAATPKPGEESEASSPDATPAPAKP